jgi:hypothetical protein
VKGLNNERKRKVDESKNINTQGVIYRALVEKS